MTDGEYLLILSRAARCQVPDCGWESAMTPSKTIASCFAVWHVYEDHREEWIRIFGDRPPNDPDPRDPDVLYMLMRVN